MTKTKKLIPDTQQVTEHINTLPASAAAIIEATRQIILSAHKEIAEQIKWNSPSFYYTGPMKPFDPKEYKRDIVVINLHRGNILLVFPTGAKVPDPEKLFNTTYKDGRGIINIDDMQDLENKRKGLADIVQRWISMVE